MFKDRKCSFTDVIGLKFRIILIVNIPMAFFCNLKHSLKTGTV